MYARPLFYFSVKNVITLLTDGWILSTLSWSQNDRMILARMSPSSWQRMFCLGRPQASSEAWGTTAAWSLRALIWSTASSSVQQPLNIELSYTQPQPDPADMLLSVVIPSSVGGLWIMWLWCLTFFLSTTLTQTSQVNQPLSICSSYPLHLSMPGFPCAPRICTVVHLSKFYCRDRCHQQSQDPCHLPDWSTGFVGYIFTHI